MAWEGALESTWWYALDPLKPFDNFTFWCGQFPPLLTLWNVPEVHRGTMEHIAVVYYQGQVQATILLDVMKLLDHEDVGTQPGYFGDDDNLYFKWVAGWEKKIPCARFLPDKEVECAIGQITMDIFTVFKDSHFTTKHSIQCFWGDHEINDDDLYFNLYHYSSWGQVSLYLDCVDSLCEVNYVFEEDVQDIYNKFNGYAEMHDPDDRDLADYLILFREIEELVQGGKRGWGETREALQEMIISVSN